MAMVYCPECGSRVSGMAVSCPHCGFAVQSEKGLVPLGSLPPAELPLRIVVPEASVFGGMNLVPWEDNNRIAGLLKDSKRMKELAPSVFHAIEELASDGKTQYAAAFSKKAEELMREGALVLSVDRKSGEFIPQLRSVKTGQIYEKARIKPEVIKGDVAQSLAAVQLQVSMAEMMDEIKAIAANVEALRLENQADRIAEAEAVWQRLQQATLIRDARLRGAQIQAIANDATKSRVRLQANYREQSRIVGKGKGKSGELALAAHTALTDLTVIALMARTEYAAWSLLEERAPAEAALGQLREFIVDSGLDDRQALVRLNSYNAEDRGDIVDGFIGIAEKVVSLQIEGSEVVSKLVLDTEVE